MSSPLQNGGEGLCVKRYREVSSSDECRIIGRGERHERVLNSGVFGAVIAALPGFIAIRLR
jgi:hypothetical protein